MIERIVVLPTSRNHNQHFVRNILGLAHGYGSEQIAGLMRVAQV